MNESVIVIVLTVAILGGIAGLYLLFKSERDRRDAEDEAVGQHKAMREHKGSAHFRFDGNASGENGDR